MPMYPLWRWFPKSDLLLESCNLFFWRNFLKGQVLIIGKKTCTLEEISGAVVRPSKYSPEFSMSKGIRISLYTVFEIFVSASSPLSPIIFFNFNILQGSFSNSPRQRPKLKSGRTETKQKICLPIFWLLARKLSQTKNLQMFKSLIPPLLPLLPPFQSQKLMVEPSIIVLVLAYDLEIRSTVVASLDLQISTPKKRLLRFCRF